MPDRQIYAITSAAKNAEMDAHTVQIRIRYAPGGALVGSSSDEGSTTTWSVFVARSLTMRAISILRFFLILRLPGRAVSSAPNFSRGRYGRCPAAIAGESSDTSTAR